MIIYQKKITPYSQRLLGAIFSPIFLFFIIPAFVSGYFAWEAEAGSSFKSLWIVTGLFAFIGIIAYYNLLKSIITVLIQLEIIPEGLKVTKVVRDEVVHVVIPQKHLQPEIRKHRSTGNRDRVTYSYSLEIFDGSSLEPVCELKTGLVELGEILKKIEAHTGITLKAGEKDFLVLYEKQKHNQPSKWMRAIPSIIGVSIIALFAGVFIDYRYNEGKFVEGWLNSGGDEFGLEFQVESFQAINIDQLIDFPKTWHRLYSTGDGFERQQLCDKEATIEILERDSSYWWRDTDYEYSWEAKLIAFAINEDDDYAVKLAMKDGSTKDILISLHKRATKGKRKIYFINSVFHTPLPEPFPVRKETNDCQ